MLFFAFLKPVRIKQDLHNIFNLRKAVNESFMKVEKFGDCDGSRKIKDDVFLNAWLNSKLKTAVPNKVRKTFSFSEISKMSHFNRPRERSEGLSHNIEK